MQLCKYYGPLTLSQGPINVYAYEEGQPVKTFEGYINNPPFVDGGGEYGVYYSSCALKGSTQLTGRTWDKVYVYYKDGEYIPYESEYIEISELWGYDNFEEAVNEGIKEICSTKYRNFNVDKLNITINTENVNNRLIYVYQCEIEGKLEYFTLFNGYINKSGRIYLNLTNWNDRNDFLNSTIWNDDEWHTIYNDPVESADNFHDVGAGYNYYIIFRNYNKVLEVEEAIEYIESKRVKRTFKQFQEIVDKYGFNTHQKNMIHIAGTNGKGSTANFIKEILMKHGYKVA